MVKRVAILGAGGMGTALAILLARAGAKVFLWSRSSAHAEELARSRENVRHLPGAKLPAQVQPVASACEAAAGADLVVVAIPSAYLRETLRHVAVSIPANVPILSVVKGIENESFARPSQVIEAILGARPVAVLSGPSHAEELAQGLPASLVVACSDQQLAVRVRDTLNQGMLRVYTNPDALGVELAGALKNILGIAAGICDGLGFGDNAKAALLTRGLVEITRFAVAQGAQSTTFFGLAGIGDLITTCYSPFGRNRALGERLARGATLQEAQAATVNVAEGVPTTRSVYELAGRQGVEMPITEAVYRVLFEAAAPKDAAIALLVREPKVEWVS
jgi:glycerol-3-phosphate dehydrogenase (NAD(P)+)